MRQGEGRRRGDASQQPGESRDEGGREKKLHRLNTRSISPGTFSELRYVEGCRRLARCYPSARDDERRRVHARVRRRHGERSGVAACRLRLGVYLGRDMKNASNGPRGTSPFKSTAILLPTCHHFSDQKLPARVTFPVRRLRSARHPCARSNPASRKDPSACLALNKARETLLHAGRIPGLCI